MTNNVIINDKMYYYPLKIKKGITLETCTYGINGSIRKRLDHQTQNTDYYYFNASGNLKACGTDMQISVYGYNSANTRTYKVNLFNANQWVNGQPQPIQPMVQNAMFYPNTYINFTQAGEYTKHYYNGTERICSRLGEQQVSISVENDQELLNYQHDTKEILRNAIGQHLYDEPTDMQEGDVIPLEFLQPCGNNNAVFYYHPNHLSSSMYVTDAQQSVVQSFLYAPYGEIISEYNTHAMGEAFPKYSFNAKELDEETGMYYYEARYYAPPTFTSRDLLFEKYFWMSPYAYCANNPVKYVDPTGKEMELNDDYYLNLKTGLVEYHEGSSNRFGEGLIHLAGDDATYGDIEDALAEKGYEYQKNHSVKGGFQVNTEKQYKGWIMMQYGKLYPNLFNIALFEYGLNYYPNYRISHKRTFNIPKQSNVQFTSVDNLINKAGKLDRLKGGVKQGVVHGDANNVFKELAQQYNTKIQKNGSELFFQYDNIRVGLHESTTGGGPTLHINRGGQLYKIRFTK